MPKHETKPIDPLNPEQINRFRNWTKICDSDDECWPWIGPLNDRGYGQIRIGKRMCKAHRIAWIITYGRDPHPKCVLHTCDNPPCVNPKHLWLGTVGDNNHDMAKKGRSKRGDLNPARLHPELMERGEQRYNAKMTEEKVRELRRLRSEGWQYKDLIQKFGIDLKTAWLIIERKAWKHVK